MTPGDVILFDVATLHGGAPTHAGQRRRTLTLRFFGQRTTYQPKGNRRSLPNTPGMADRLQPGEPFRDDRFLKLWPRAGGPAADA